MPSVKELKKGSLIKEEISEINKKILLYEGSKRGYLEKTQWSIQRSRDHINRMRKENIELHQVFHDWITDEKYVIEKGYQGHNIQRPTFPLKSGTLAISLIDQKVCENKKSLNAMRGKTKGYENQIKTFETEDAALVRQVEERAKFQRMSNRTTRQLENSLDKARLKLVEAEKINKMYLFLHAGMKREGLFHQKQLKKQETIVKAAQKELSDFQIMYGESQVCRDWMKQEMKDHEESLLGRRSNHDNQYNQLKELGNDMKQNDMLQEARLQRAHIKEMGLYEMMRKPSISATERALQLENFEDLYSFLYKHLGKTDPQEIVTTLKVQRHTEDNILDSKMQNSEKIKEMEQKVNSLTSEYDSIKYYAKDNTMRWKSLVKDRKQDLANSEERGNEFAKTLRKNNKFLAYLSVSFKHLEDIVKYCEKGKGSYCWSPDDFLDSFYMFSSKIVKLHDTLKEKKESGELLDVQGEGYHDILEPLFPSGNIRISSLTSRLAVEHEFEDAEESKDNEIADQARQLMKMKSLKLIEIQVKRYRRYSSRKKNK